MYTTERQQNSSSGTTAAVLQALAFVPVTVHVRGGAQQQEEIELRQHFHVQCNHETHIVGPRTKFTKHAAAAKKEVGAPYTALERLCSPF